METEGENNNDSLENISNDEDENGEMINDVEFINETIEIRDSGIVRRFTRNFMRFWSLIKYYLILLGNKDF